MDNMIIEGLDTLDRDQLMKRLADELPVFTGEMGTTPGEIARRAGLEPGRISQIMDGKRSMKWSEYMCILFVLWSDERSHELVESNGMFPDELQKAMSVNRNEHERSFK